MPASRSLACSRALPVRPTQMSTAAVSAAYAARESVVSAPRLIALVLVAVGGGAARRADHTGDTVEVAVDGVGVGVDLRPGAPDGAGVRLDRVGHAEHAGQLGVDVAHLGVDRGRRADDGRGAVIDGGGGVGDLAGDAVDRAGGAVDGAGRPGDLLCGAQGGG